jgi:hypothetical protein
VFAILCTGPSMSQAVADSVRHLHVVAVNACYELAPWADALAANDTAWWSNNPQAQQFKGRKFSSNVIRGVERITDDGRVRSEHCSGVVGLEVAKHLGATRILLLGVDFHGSHYFGDYTGRLRNTTDLRRKHHAKQFAEWGKTNKGVEVLNCTEGSELKCFPMARLDEVLSASMVKPALHSAGAA